MRGLLIQGINKVLLQQIARMLCFILMGFRQGSSTAHEQLTHFTQDLEIHQVIKYKTEKIYACNLLKQRFLGWDCFPLSILSSGSLQRHNLRAQEKKI